MLNAAALQRQPWAQCSRAAGAMINAMGDRSAMAQGLIGPGNRPNPITQAHTLSETNARLYLLAQPSPSGGAPVLVGLLKVGTKQLYHWDAQGRTHELKDCASVLDFYVHENYQRGGFGKVRSTHVLDTPCSLQRASRPSLSSVAVCT